MAILDNPGQIWMGSIPEPTFVLGGVRIGMGCMNLVTVISRYTRVPVTLSNDAKHARCLHFYKTVSVQLEMTLKSYHCRQKLLQQCCSPTLLKQMCMKSLMCVTRTARHSCWPPHSSQWCKLGVTEFWYGLRNMHCLTSRDTMQLRVELNHSNGTGLTWTYHHFRVDGPDNDYRLHINRGEGPLGVYVALRVHNGTPFRTFDNDMIIVVVRTVQDNTGEGGGSMNASWLLSYQLSYCYCYVHMG